MAKQPNLPSESRVAGGCQPAPDEQWRLAAIVNSSPDAIITKTPDGIITSWSPGAEKMFGYAAVEAIGKPGLALFPPERADEEREILARVVQGGRIEHFETVRVCKDGSRIQVSVTIAPITAEGGKIIGVSKIARDLTEREAQVEEIGRLRALMDNLPDTIYFKDVHSRFTCVNQAQAQNLGLPNPEAAIGKSDADFFSPQLARQKLADERALLTTGKPILDLVEKSGTTDCRKWVSSTKVPIYGPDGQIVGLVGISRDITERRAQAEEIARLSRLYAALSQINQAIVRTHSREDLFAEICRAIIEHGRFKLAWIGWLNAETKEVNLVAQHGEAGASDYMEGVRLFADDRPEGRGPTGICLREGRTYVCQDFATDPATPPWREAAARQGLAASVSVPCRLGGAVCGALMVYAAEKNFFGNAEVALLEEAAVDISFALDHLAAEQQRRQAEQAIRESEERYRQLFELESDAIVLVDGTTHRLLEVNQSAQQLYGYSREEFLQLTAEEISAEPEKTRKIVGSGNYRVPLRWHHKKSGEKFAVEITANLIQYRGQTAELTAIRDITERKLAEEKLAAEQSLLNSLLANTPDRIYFKDRESRFIKVNDAVARMHEFPEARILLGKTDFDIFDEPQARRFYEAEQRLMATGEPLLDQEEREVWPDGHVTWICNTKLPLLDGSGKITGLVGVTRDITERKRHEQQLARLNDCFAGLGVNPEENLRQLAALCGELSQAAFALYYRLQDGWLSAVGWQLPPDFPAREPAEGRMATEVILQDIGAPVILRDLPRSACAQTDPAVAHYGLKTCVGQTVHCQGIAIGALCLVFQDDLEPDPQILKVVQIIATAMGIEEERRQAERRLVDALNFNQTVIRAAPVGIVVYKGTGECVSANAAAAEIVGGTKEQLLQQNFRQLESWKRDGLVAVAEAALAGGQNQILEIRAKSTFGRECWLFCRFVPFCYANETQLLVTINDISERKRAEERMKLQLSAMTAAANAIVIADRDGKIEWVNPAFTKLTGYSAEEAVGKNRSLLNSGRQTPAFYASLWETILTGKVWHGELANQRKDGTLYTEEMTITPVRGGDGQIAHFVAIEQDVTERRQFENRLLHAQKMEAIGTLAGGIAHDFNNILTAMYGFAFLVRAETGGNHAAQQNVAEILAAVNRAKELVQQILTFSRKREQNRQVIRLEAVVREAIKFLRASLPAQIWIEMDLAAGTPSVLADPTQIYQVTVNLATNALHAMEDRPGLLTVLLDSFVPDEEFIQAHPDFRPVEYARLTVADTGCGMDAPTLARIFEPFFTTKPVGKGTGLGLAVVHGIVHSHEGAITVASRVGEGTTFCLYFPGRTSGAVPAAVAGGEAVRGQGQKILLVDDEPSLTKALALILARLNYQVTASNNPCEAIALFRADPAQFDLVITDLTMPEVNGLAVARQLHALRPNLPVILASGYGATLTPEKLHEAGIWEFVEKPVSLNVLASAIQRALVKT